MSCLLALLFQCVPWFCKYMFTKFFAKRKNNSFAKHNSTEVQTETVHTCQDLSETKTAGVEVTLHLSCWETDGGVPHTRVLDIPAYLLSDFGSLHHKTA